MPFLHCGTWLYHAARLPQVNRVFHVGGDVDFDNFYRCAGAVEDAPPRQARRHAGHPSVSRRRLGPGAERTVRDHPQAPLRPPLLRDRLIPYREELARMPLYISLDKDVMVPADAIVNWDSGHLGIDEVRDVLSIFLDAARGNLVGMDVLGDWSPVQVDGLFRWAFHMTMHPSLAVVPTAANQVNQRANLALVETVRECMKPARRAG